MFSKNVFCWIGSTVLTFENACPRMSFRCHGFRHPDSLVGNSNSPHVDNICAKVSDYAGTVLIS